jgi:hypothetical protein
MHCACLFENKEQYDKAGKILTFVLQNALEKCHLTREQYDAFDAFQLILVEKERYLAYFVWKHIPMTFDAMTTSPVECVTSDGPIIVIRNKNVNEFVMIEVYKLVPVIAFLLWNFKHGVQELQNQPMMHPKVVLQKTNVVKGY